jgi:hypothetical protein
MFQIDIAAVANSPVLPLSLMSGMMVSLTYLLWKLRPKRLRRSHAELPGRVLDVNALLLTRSER